MKEKQIAQRVNSELGVFTFPETKKYMSSEIAHFILSITLYSFDQENNFLFTQFSIGPEVAEA
jgi:hypothetical protein